MDISTSRKEEADKICKYFCVDVYFHPVCNAPEDIREKCQMHSTEEGIAGYELDITKVVAVKNTKSVAESKKLYASRIFNIPNIRISQQRKDSCKDYRYNR